MRRCKSGRGKFGSFMSGRKEGKKEGKQASRGKEKKEIAWCELLGKRMAVK